MNLVFNRTTSYYSTAPAILEFKTGGMYLYRYDLQELPNDKSDSSDESTPQEGTKYSYVEVYLKGYPNINEVIKYLLRQLVTLEDELKLINDYNETLKYSDVPEDTDEFKNYMAYLEFRHNIKVTVKKDFKNYKF